MAQAKKVSLRAKITCLLRPLHLEVSQTGLRLVELFLLTSLLGFYISMFITSYFSIELTSSLSFNVGDGWCGESEWKIGIGKHCFGDYYYNFRYFESESPYETLEGTFPNAYPPVAMFLFKLFTLLAQTTIGSQFVLILYLVFLVFPIGFLVLKLFKFNLAVKVLLVCLTSLPMISGLDRGNIVLIIIPFLFLFGKNYLIKNSAAPMYLLPVILIKPQFALILLIYFNNLEIRVFIKSILSSITALILSFLFFPSSFIENVKSWFSALVSFQDYNKEASHYPISLSGVNLLALPFKFFKSRAEGSVVDVEINGQVSQIVSISLILMALMVFSLAKSHHFRFERLLLAFLLPILVPSSSSSYYAIVFIPIFLLVISNSEKFTESYSKEKSIQIVLLLIGILCCFPLTLPLQFFTSFGVEGTEITVNWYLICYLILASYLILVVVHMRRLFKGFVHDSKQVAN